MCAKAGGTPLKNTPRKAFQKQIKLSKKAIAKSRPILNMEAEGSTPGEQG